MIIGNTIDFDNTLSIRNFANSSECKAILNSSAIKGNEKQLYNIGDTVDGNASGFTSGLITDTYTQNGYIYYVVTYKLKPNAKKEYKQTLRQKDIIKI